MHFPICFLARSVLFLFQKLSMIFLPAKGRNLTTRFTIKDELTVKKYEILEQQITTSKLEGIHNCADRTDKFVSKYAYSDVE